MNIMLLLEMAAGAAPDRLALGERADGLSYEHLYDLAGRAAAEFQGLGVERVVYAAESSPALPVALFGAAWAGMPFVPVNYRLADDRLRLIASRQVPAVLLCDAGTEHRSGHRRPDVGHRRRVSHLHHWPRGAGAGVVTGSRGCRSAPAHQRHQR